MCGIFGIITSKPTKLDLRTFCVLGVNNDSRGGDSCGIFIDKKYEYGVNESKLFYNFFPTSKLLASKPTCQIALGHCRKASVGAINVANAQPVVIRDNNGEVSFVLIHNGTITNYKELAKVYIPDIDITGMTDSQVIALIFYHSGYEVLGNYLGAGAFVMVDYREGEPKVLLFKGESKQYQYSTATTVERPLFCTYDNSEFIFSSIMEYLKPLRPDREVKTLQPNNLIELKNGKLIILKEYDRKSLWQISSTYNTNYYNYYNNVYNSSVVCSEKYNKSKNITRHYWDDAIDMDKNGVYMLGNVRAHGVYWVDVLGNVEDNKKPGVIQAAFWKGVLLKNASCYSFLQKFARDMDCPHNDLLIAMPDLIHFLSPCACWRTNKGQWVVSDTPNSHYPYTGTAIFPFTTEEVYFSAGKMDSFSEGIPYKESLFDLVASANYKVDYNAIEKLL